MRVRFFQPDDEAETAAYLAKVAAIDSFWKEFDNTICRLDRTEAVGPRWVSHLRAWLGRVDPGLGVEFEQREDGLRSCTILPVQGEHLLPLAQLMVERAPARPPWAFSAQREAMALERCLRVVREDCDYDLSTARARVGVARGHCVEVVIGSEHTQGADDEAALDAAQCLVTRLIGDEWFDDWVEQVSVVPQTRPSSLQLLGKQSAQLPLGLNELFPAIVAAVQGIVAGLPEQACHADCERADWVMFEVGQLEREGDALPLSDLAIASSMRPEMFRCLLEGRLFSSSRFSRCGERFCYLKLRLPGPSIEQRIDARVHLEQVLDRALVPGRLGCVVGAGVGAEYVYVVLALTQLEPALALVRSRLLEAGVGADAWLFFCDSCFRDEWIGMGPGSPPPTTR